MTARETQLADLVSACHARLTRYEVDGVSLLAIGRCVYQRRETAPENHARHVLDSFRNGMTDGWARAFLHRIPRAEA